MEYKKEYFCTINKNKMASIKIKNFGPITEGYTENNGFINIDKVMVFIGGQGSGKSTIVKLISTISWLEKALYKKSISIDDIINANAFQEEWCEYQSIQNYFKENTYIEYNGNYLSFKYEKQEITIELNENDFQLPKITYIPAERNLLSILEDIENVKISLKSLRWTLDEYIRACRSQIKPIPIGINDIIFEYNLNDKTAFIHGNDFEKLKLSEASSGIQSIVPLVNVIYYLEHFINSKKLNSIDNLSFTEREELEKLEKEIINDNRLTSEEKSLKGSLVTARFLPNHLLTIIEEIEQNLFPDSQKRILFNMLQRVNNRNDNKLILTTHSPYIIAYLTLAMKANNVKAKINQKEELLDKLNHIVPIDAVLDSNHVGIYQIDVVGNVYSIKTVGGLIKDDNYLNLSLEETNNLFDELLDIEELCR